MSYEFKKLSEVEALTEVPEGAKVIAEVNGEIVRVPGSGLGGGSGVEIPKPLTYDYMPEGYPTKSGFKIEWDGNTEGLSSVDIDGGVVIYKISDLAPTYEELVGATYKNSSGVVTVLGSNNMTNQDDGSATLIFGTAALVNRNMPELEPGTYARAEGLIAYTREISKQTVTPMSPDFIPTVPYILINSSTADSTKVFKLTVDDSGTLRATEVTN